MISNNKEKDQIPLEREPSEKKESPPKLCILEVTYTDSFENELGWLTK